MTPRQEEARRLALSGLTVKQIAVEMGITRQGVEYNLKATGTEPFRVVKYSDHQIASLHQEGLTDTEIAAELGISTDTVSNVRHRLGIKAHDRILVLGPSEVECLLNRAREGTRQVVLAKEFGIAQNTVSTYLIKHGLRRHTKRTAKQ